MADRPIIFSAPMVRALLAGRKTQTRRIIKAQPSTPLKAGDYVGLGGFCMVGDVTWPLRPGVSIVSNKPGPHPRWVEEHVKYAPGDRLYVRERVHIDGAEVNYAADQPAGLDLRGLGYRPSIHMPRSASRLTLTVTNVRVERLNDISEADAIAEGIEALPDGSPVIGNPFGLRLGDQEGFCSGETAVEAFQALWQVIHGADAWTANPWVVAVTFTVHRANIDALDIAARAA